VPFNCQTHAELCRLAVLGFAISAAPRVAAASDALRVLSLDVSQAPAVKMPAPMAYEKPSWRTSFGSQRQSQPIPASAVPGLDADVVLLQGVTSVKVLNRVFPGRKWRVVVSRQMVLTDDPVDPRSYEAVSAAPATAIAVRYQPGIRVAGQEHFLARALQNSAGQPEASVSRPVAATAVRLNLGGRFVWVASVAFGDDCADATKSCPPRTDLEAWRQAKLALGEAVITGGLRQTPMSLATAAANDTGAPCELQGVIVSSARKEATPWTARAEAKSGLGCAAKAEAGGEVPDGGTASAGAEPGTPPAEIPTPADKP
jgi:hypothetical protein